MTFSLFRSGFGHMVIQMTVSYANGELASQHPFWHQEEAGERERRKAVRFSRQDEEVEGTVDPE